MRTEPDASVRDAALAAALFAVDPFVLGGVVLRAAPGPVRDRWLDVLRSWLPRMPWRRIPAHVDDDRLLGGLDLPATLAAGRPVARRGLLAELDGGVALVPMAERLAPALAAHLARALDLGEVAVERAGVTLRAPARLAVVALDEGVEDESVPAVLADRLAIWAALPAASPPLAEALAEFADERVAAARARLPAVLADADPLAALCGTAMALGIASLRAPLLALRVACAHAALAGRARLTDDDLTVAARLVLAGRATVLPPQAEAAPATEPPPPARSHEETPTDDGGERPQDLLVQAALAHLPPHVLQSRERVRARGVRAPAGRSGARSASGLRGRPLGIRQGAPRRGERLALVATLYAAAPWQRLRRRERGALGRRARFEVRGEDLRALRFAQRTPTTTLFVVDASGSTAAQRLAEAKGAVELLLAECYVRRDRVALIAFRGQGAALLLPPTRSLVRARRELAALPGGGGTPLAAGLLAAARLTATLRRAGDSVAVVLLTDGRANVAADGQTDRARAERDAEAAARALRATGCTAVLIDTASRPQPLAQRLAEALDARYLPLPHADAPVVARAVHAPRRGLASGLAVRTQ